MNRRGFLSSVLTGAIATIAAPQIVVHGLRLKTVRTAYGVWVINPEWENAQLELRFVVDEALKTCEPRIFTRDAVKACSDLLLPDPYPLRFRMINGVIFKTVYPSYDRS